MGKFDGEFEGRQEGEKDGEVEGNAEGWEIDGPIAQKLQSMRARSIYSVSKWPQDQHIEPTI